MTQNETVFEVRSNYLLLVLFEEQSFVLNNLIFFFQVQHFLEVELSTADNRVSIVNELQETFVDTLGNFEVVLSVVPDWRIVEGVFLEFSLSDLFSNSESHGYVVLPTCAGLSPDGGTLESEGHIIEG